MVLVEGHQELTLHERASSQGLVPKDAPSTELLDEAAENEAAARRAAEKAVRVRKDAERAAQRRHSAENEAKEREEAARRCEQRAQAAHKEAERLRLEAERLSREADAALQKKRRAELEAQKCREDEIRLSSDADELQVVAVEAAAKAQTTFAAAAAAAAQDLFGRPLVALPPVAQVHPAEEMHPYPRKEEAAHAEFILSRTGHNLDSHGGAGRVYGVRSSWGTSDFGLEGMPRPSTKASMIESVDERLVVAVLHSIVRGSSRAVAGGGVSGRLPEALLREAAACFQSRDGDSFRAVLDRLCTCSIVKADLMVGVELIRSGLSKALGALIEEDRDSARQFIRGAFSQDVLLAGEDLLEQLEQWSSEQAIVDYRKQGQDQAQRPRPRVPPRPRELEMHRRQETSVYSVVQVTEGDDGWDMNDSSLFLNSTDVLSGAQGAVQDHLRQQSHRDCLF